VFVNQTANNLRAPGELQTMFLQLILVFALSPLALAAYHLTQQPTQETLKLRRVTLPAHEFATVTGR
jgi:hypothetical protein